MREYIIAFNGSWLHFFIKPHVGLCSRKKNGYKFDDFKILLPGAAADFCVYSKKGLIHIVCQDERGSVIYLLFDGINWNKNILLESKTARPYLKNFVITELSGHINVLYTVENKEKLMLVHQVLLGNMVPNVVDYITGAHVPFCVYKHHETDFSIFYTNNDGLGCERIYKWSQKQFLPPSLLEDGVSIKFACENDTRPVFAAIKTEGKISNLLYFEKNETDDYIPFPVSLDCDKNITPIISRYGKKLFMVWSEHGNVISSSLMPDGKWSNPVQYAKSSKSEAKLYAICNNGDYEYYYGIAREYDITLYGTHDILKTPPAKVDPGKNVPFENPYNKTEHILNVQEKQIKILCQELSIQREKLSELSAKIEELLSSIPLADEEDIDTVLLK